MILEALLLSGAGFFLYKDYQKGFIRTKTLIEKVSGGRFKLIDKNKDQHLVLKAQNAIETSAKTLAKLRESVADIEANMKMARQQAAEQIKLVQRFSMVIEQAVNKDEEAAAAAAMAKIEARKRADMFVALAKEQEKILVVVRQNLEEAEIDFDIRKTQADTVRVYVDITNARRQLYGLVSAIDPNFGLSAKGELDQALLDSQREMFKTEALLGMIQHGNGHKTKMFLQLAEVNVELETARKRIALPEAVELQIGNNDEDEKDEESVVAGAINE